MTPFHQHLKSLIIGHGVRLGTLGAKLGYNCPSSFSAVITGRTSLPIDKAHLLEKEGIGEAKDLLQKQLEWQIFQYQKYQDL